MLTTTLRSRPLGVFRSSFGVVRADRHVLRKQGLFCFFLLLLCLTWEQTRWPCQPKGKALCPWLGATPVTGFLSVLGKADGVPLCSSFAEGFYHERASDVVACFFCIMLQSCSLVCQCG